MTMAFTLYVDHKGHPAPLLESFHATASRCLSSTTTRYPPSSITAIDSAFCPDSLTPQDPVGYSNRCQRCPLCITSTLRVSIEGERCFYECANCNWRSEVSVPIEGNPSKLELARAAEELALQVKEERQPVEHKDLFAENRVRRTIQARRSTRRLFDRDDEWSLEALESALETKRQEKVALPEESVGRSSLKVTRLDIHDDEDTPTFQGSIRALQWQAVVRGVHRDDLLPLPVPLRARRSRRCRAELALGRPGILVKPKLNPLEGDSSLRTGHGQWWRKDSSAVHIIPRAQILKHMQKGTTNHFLLQVSNPTLGLIRLRFGPSSYEGELDWDGKRTKFLPSLLVDTITQLQWDLNLVETAGDALTTEVTELASAEDMLLEMGGGSGKKPDAVVNWAGQGTATQWIAQDGPDAWIEVVVEAPSVDAGSKLGFPLRMQIEIGNGSWESSLIEQDTTKETDWFELDLVLAWEASAE